MKQLNQHFSIKSFIALIMLCLVQTALWAQESGSTSTTTTKTTTVSENSNWYTSPWVWVVGAAVFILLLVALTRSGGRSGSTDRVSVTKEVRRDTNI